MKEVNFRYNIQGREISPSLTTKKTNRIEV